MYLPVRIQMNYLSDYHYFPNLLGTYKILFNKIYLKLSKIGKENIEESFRITWKMTKDLK